jgi:phage FluMu protein Com
MSDNSKDIIRCSACKKVLCEGAMHHGSITIKCKCGTFNTIQASQGTSYQDRLKETFEIKRVPSERQ